MTIPMICDRCRVASTAGTGDFSYLGDLLEFEPVPRPTKRVDGWSAEKQRAFIALLATTGSQRRASLALGMAPYVFGRLSLELINEQIDDVLAKRKPTGVGLINRFPICNFEYSDDTQMATSVMLFVGEDEEALIAQCDFDSSISLRVRHPFTSMCLTSRRGNFVT